MKLIIAIISNDDEEAVQASLIKGGYKATKLLSTGGFLMKGNITFLIGAEDNLVEGAITIIKQHCRSRKKVIPNSIISAYDLLNTTPIEVNVGGATIFVIDVCQFLHI